jgi:phosphonate transport system substrate-binding protein
MKRQKRRTALIFAVVVLLFAAAHADAGEAQEKLRIKTISLGIVTQRSQAEMEPLLRDFIGYVARRLSPAENIKGRVAVAPSVWQLVKQLEQKQVDFYMDSPYPTYLINHQNASVLLLRRWKGGSGDYRSVLFGKKGDGVARLEDLPGRMVAFEDPASTSGYFLPKLFLIRSGLKLVEKPSPEATVPAGQVGFFFARSTGKIVDLVLARTVAAGAFSNEDYDRLPEKRKESIAILGETEYFPRNLLSVRKDLDPAVIGRLEDLLLAMHQDEEGRKVLQKTEGTTKFDVLPGGETIVRQKLAELFGPLR